MTVIAVPFQPKADRPEWRILYEDLLDGLDFGDLVTYEQLDEALGRDFRANRVPLKRARQELLRTQKRALRFVTNKGYRVAEAREHRDLAQSEHLFGRRKVRRATDLALHVEHSKLTPEERAEIDRLALAYRRHEQLLRRLDAKVERQAKVIAEHGEAISEMAEVRDQVTRLQTLLEERGFTTPATEQT